MMAINYDDLLDCEDVKREFAFYDLKLAAVLWCGVSEEDAGQVLAELIALDHDVYKHPHIPCVEYRIRAMHRAIDDGVLPACREHGRPPNGANDYIARHRRHVIARDLRAWIEQEFPDSKPAFLFPEHANDEQASESAKLRARIKDLEEQLQAAAEEATEDKGASTKTINTQNGIIAAMALYIQGNKPQGFSEGKSLRAGAEQIIDKLNGIASQYNIKKSVICPSTLESYIKVGLEKIKE